MNSTFSAQAYRAFETRHTGTLAPEDLQPMLKAIGVSSVSELIDKTVPAGIRLPKPLSLPSPQTEEEFLASFKELMGQNKVFKNYIGQGYYGTYTPRVVLRNILENPGWYTAYTPYQAEIAQGRLEMLLNFQTLVIDLTGMPIANASLLDEGTAAAEAMAMLAGQTTGTKKDAKKFFVASNVFEQTKAVLRTRATPVGIELVEGDWRKVNLEDPDLYGLLIQYPGLEGELPADIESFIASAKEHNVFVAVAADLLSLTLLKAPGEMGADVVLGTTQRFGIPMGFGGPHAAYFATKEEYKRHIPGRIIGVSVDGEGNRALRMALQTREQHIRREKATSNICTAQVLLGVMAAAYAIYHGPEGLKAIAGRIHALTRKLADAISGLPAMEVLHANYFDTLTVKVPRQATIKALAETRGINLFYAAGEKVSISLDETTSVADIEAIAEVFALAVEAPTPKINAGELVNNNWPSQLQRTSTYLQHPVFHKYQSEHEMLRYLKKLENKDISLTHSMISLGSCTMKLNSTTEMIPVTWESVGGIHPFAPANQWKGYAEMFKNLEAWLSEITGFAGVSLQPNSGAQGEYTGLLVIKAYHENRGEGHRNIALIPQSAHGTNPASAVMVGMKVVVVKCDERGNVDMVDLQAKAEQYSKDLACLMVTYPSTHGVFETNIKEICALIHAHGGQVYMDGANMNAQVGLTSPGFIGADVCHLNLHKTFCIPHGGGGPGMGPIGVAAHLVPFLPKHPLIECGGEHGISPVSAAPFGSASILVISYAYISMMGAEGLTRATEHAILNANYIKAKLEGAYKILYTGENGFCAHEMIVDFRPFKALGVEVEDIAKRLMDYGFHAPTVSFPVAGTIMIEPTESETKEELDRFCEALLEIRQEIEEIATGAADAKNNVLKNAPHTASVVLADTWERPYSRNKAAFPVARLREQKIWPTVSRIDAAYGDRNLVCACEPIDTYMEQEISA